MKVHQFLIKILEESIGTIGYPSLEEPTVPLTTISLKPITIGSTVKLEDLSYILKTSMRTGEIFQEKDHTPLFQISKESVVKSCLLELWLPHQLESHRTTLRLKQLLNSKAGLLLRTILLKDSCYGTVIGIPLMDTQCQMHA